MRTRLPIGDDATSEPETAAPAPAQQPVSAASPSSEPAEASRQHLGSASECTAVRDATSAAAADEPAREAAGPPAAASVDAGGQCCGSPAPQSLSEAGAPGMPQGKAPTALRGACGRQPCPHPVPRPALRRPGRSQTAAAAVARRLSWLAHAGLSFDDPAVESQFAAWQAVQKKTVRPACHAKHLAPSKMLYLAAAAAPRPVKVCVDDLRTLARRV